MITALGLRRLLPATFGLCAVGWTVMAVRAQVPGPPAAQGAASAAVSLTETPFLDGPGPVNTSLDAMPFYHAGIWHVFHMQSEPIGIGHRTSRDFVHWEIRPLAIAGTVATGSVVEHHGKFYFFYTANQTVHLATSTDLDHWKPLAANPLVTGDDRRYATVNFRDPYVFFNVEEERWWMLIGTQVPGRLPQRSGCVGLFKSDDLLHWEAAEPLWTPNVGYHCDCPQLIQQNNRWYLLYLHRELRYRLADSPTGPWQRPTPRSLSGHTSYAGSRLATDGRRWVSFPFLCAQQGGSDFGDLINGELYGVPRQFDFRADGHITERPVEELITALHDLPAPASNPFTSTQTLSGQWDVPEPCACAARGKMARCSCRRSRTISTSNRKSVLRDRTWTPTCCSASIRP